jgi:hypothetical protein
MAVVDVVMSIVSVWRTVAIGLLTPIVYFVYRFIRIRTMMRRLQAQGLVCAMKRDRFAQRKHH